MKLGEVLFYEQPTKYIVESEFYNDNYKTPVLTAGKSFILGYTNETNGIYDNLPCIIFDDFTTDIKYVDFPFKVKSSAMKILTTDKNNDIRYLYHYLSIVKVDTELHKRYWISMFAELNVNLPPLPAQQQIAKELDTVCGAIAKQKKQLKLCDSLIKSKFNEMFGDKHNNKIFHTVNIFKVCKDIFAGGDVPQSAFSKTLNENHSIPVFANGEKNKGLYGYTNKARVYENAITISARGTIGYTEIRKEPFFPIVRLICVIPKEKLINIVYFKYTIAQVLEIKGAGTSIPQLTVPMVKKNDIILPPLPLQQQFADFVNQVDQNKTKIKQALNEIETLYKALMQKYFGEKGA